MAQRVDLVLCRLDAEDVSWATKTFSPKANGVRVLVYGTGNAVGDLSGAIGRTLQQGSHETTCYLAHIERLVDEYNDTAKSTVFSPARPRCEGNTACTEHVVRVVLALASGQASIAPNGFAPVQSSPVVDFWRGMPRTLLCLPAAYSKLSQGRDLYSDAEFTSFSPMGSFAVARTNLLATPRGWLRRASEAMDNATMGSSPNSCCMPRHTCMPWLLERLWPMLLGTPHRGCGAGAYTGYCASEHTSSLTATASLVEAALGNVRTRDVWGAVKLRLDVSRVARVARFGNYLDEEERALVFARLVTKSPLSTSLSCKTQFCAIVELLRQARAGNEADFAQYLSSAVNKSDSVIAPERARKRCRTMFVDPKVLVDSFERIQPIQRATSAMSHADERTVGQLAHSALRKLYSACLIQMVHDNRWYTRPFVYGFAREVPRTKRVN